MSLPAFDQFVEYVTTGPVIHAVEPAQHSMESPHSLAAVVRGYIHVAQLGRPVLAGSAELALVFSEWDPVEGLPDNPGIVTSAVLAPWPAKLVAAAYVIATTALLDDIQDSQTVAIPLIRFMIPAGNGESELPYDEPFTPEQITDLSGWINAHDITNAEFAALFGVTAAQLSNWLQTNPRWRFAQVLHEKFT